MNYDYFFIGLSFSASVFSTFLCLVLLGLKLAKNTCDLAVKKAIVILISFFAISIFFYSTTFFEAFSLVRLSYIKELNFQSALLMPILFYHFIFELTRLKKADKFYYFNYVTCITIGLSLYFFQTKQGNPHAGIHFPVQGFPSFWVAKEAILLASMYNVIYLTLSLYRLIRYRKNISNYSSNEEQDSLLWLYPIFVLGFLLLPGSIVFYVVPVVKQHLFFGQLLPNGLFMFFAISLCYNVFCENFALGTEDILEETITANKLKKTKEKELFINKDTFEQYIAEKKPFLNPQLKITDLLYDLMTNRSYLSQFINTTYKMNFSQYINHCRYQEYLRLQASLGATKKTQEDMILASGFRSYESFKRTQDSFLEREGADRRISS
ncbi:hypothetical protein HX062_12310 [Myroides sp. DF42-4-2]|nr:hypothetical protein [Myroides sp. NP-2]MDM1408426.1 hypothetical protein [Myroides sp. DF42-4-2]